MQFAGEPDGDRLNMRGLLSLFRRQILLIGTIIGICVLLAFLFTQNSQKLYTANADILLKATNENVTPGSGDAGDERPKGSEQIETEVQFMQSRDLAGKVFDQLKLADDPNFTGQIVGSGRMNGLLKMLGLGRTPNTPAPGSIAAGKIRDAGVNVLRGGLTVKRIGNSFALRVSITNSDPQIAARMANGYANTYVGNQVATKVAGTQAAITILRKRMEELRLQAQVDFGDVQQYRIANSLQSKSGTSLTEQEISAYNQQVAIARAQASQDAARLAAVRSGGAATSPVVNGLRGQRAVLSVRVAELTQRYLPSHPEMVTAKQQLADIDAQIDQEVSRAVRTTQDEAQSSAARLGSLEGSLGGASGKLDRNNRALINLDDLERKAAASQALYESYLNRYKEVVAGSGAEQANASLLSGASVPARPSSPNLPLNLALGLLIGTLVGAGSAIAVEGSYSGFTTPEDVERKLLVRCLGSVPLLQSVDARAQTPLATIEEHPGGAFVESIRRILSATRQSTNSRNQVVAITSAVPEEGKTMMAACLARVAAMAHEKVAIVDCDVVRRHLSIVHGGDTDPETGLAALFAGTTAIDAVAPSTALGGATLFAITKPFEDGQRLLEQGKLHRIIAQLRERFDLIILDCGPILPIAETREIVALADNVVIVTRWRATADRVVRAAVKMLPLQSLGDLGVVLNAVDLRQRLRFGDGDPELYATGYKNYYTRRK